MLSCDCGWDYEKWYWPDHYFTIYNRDRRKRCCSCKTFIAKGDECLKFSNFRNPKDDIEERILGDEVQTADWFMCEKCGEIFLNLNALDYCIDLNESMQDTLKEYWEMTGFKQEK